MFDSIRDLFELVIVVLLFLSGISYIFYQLNFSQSIKKDYQKALSENQSKLGFKKRKKLKESIVQSHLKSRIHRILYGFADIFWVVLIVIVLRSFLYEPFIIPSKSMKPGLRISDVVLVNKNVWGMRLPLFDKQITKGKPIERGDVAVFRYPPEPGISYIKRVIGLPGDRIRYDNRNLYINGERASLKEIGTESDSEIIQGGMELKQSYKVYNEVLEGRSHIIRYDVQGHHNFGPTDIVVPEGSLFVMGDNRDNSGDSRQFGFVPMDNIIGRADYILLNFKCFVGDGGCDRFFNTIE